METSEKKHDLDFEIQFYEGLLRKKPDFIEALGALGDVYAKKGLYEKSLAVDERLYRLKPNDPIVLYNLSCSYSLLNDVDKAFRSIKQAINCGYQDFYHLEQDRDLENLRSDRRFRKYFARVKDKKIVSGTL